MATGKVKWFNNAKGYGFILPEGGGEDLFAHYSAIQMDGYRTLKAGQDVEFEIVEGPKGKQATNIRGEQAADGAAVDTGDGAPATSQVVSVTVEDAEGVDLSEVSEVSEVSEASEVSSSEATDNGDKRDGLEAGHGGR